MEGKNLSVMRNQSRPGSTRRSPGGLVQWRTGGWHLMISNLINRRVLVAEDDYLQATDIARALERQESLVVGPYPEIADCVQALEQSRVQAAVLDIHLGDETAYRLADLLRLKQIPFIFVTGYDRQTIPSRFRNVRCLTKPFALEIMTLMLALVIVEHPSRR
jgi:CheY-like chemotaxis protein